MRADNRNTLIKKNGNTADIASTVISVYNTDYRQVNELVHSLKAGNIADTCENIFNYIVDRVRYQEDPPGVQWVKTPARLMADGVGDCKSMATFAASCLRCLGIQHVLRFVSFSNRKIATHVYAVAFDERGNEIIIDPVVRVQGMPKFNVQEPYTFKTDMDGTNIYKMSGIPGMGNTQAAPADDDDRYRVWIGNEAETDITPGKAWLYAKYDELKELARIAPTKKEAAALYDQMAIVAALLYAYELTGGSTSEYSRAAYVICGMIAAGNFILNSTEPDVRDDWFDNIREEITRLYDGGFAPAKISSEWWNLINTEVINQNEMPSLAGIGSISGFTPLADMLKKAGFYFLYMFIPESEVSRYPASVQKKRRTQLTVFKWVDAVDIFHRSTTLKNIFRSGIIARVGMTPEDYIRKVKLNNVRIGEPVTLVTIATVLSIITGLVALIRAIFPPKKGPTNSDVINGAADVNAELFTLQKKDNPTGTGNGVTSASLSTWALPLALGAAFIISKFKK